MMSGRQSSQTASNDCDGMDVIASRAPQTKLLGPVSYSLKPVLGEEKAQVMLVHHRKHQNE